MESENHIKEVSKPTQLLRQVILALSSHFFKRKFNKDPENGFSKLEELADQGYGSLIGINHFSAGDTPAVVARIFASPVLGKRELLLPIAFHQHRKLYDIVGGWLGIRIVPIVISDTLEYAKIPAEEAAEKYFKGKYKEKHKKEYKENVPRKRAMHLLIMDLLKGYANGAVDNLHSGGVTYIALQGGGRSYLDEVTNALGMVLNRANRNAVENIAISFLGLGLLEEGVEVKDYHDRGFNRNKVYTVTEGITMTKEELEERAKDPAIIARAKEIGLRPRGLRLRGVSPADYIGYEELAKVVSQSYLLQETAA